ncbi:hypothetical protein [Kitasatospora sp. NPDC091276]|uniref:hypothetical protein n=1 Tax=Kitasatospora sp. NPDC091276 TaxID=3155300 RepID=UPI00343E2A3B
MPDAPSALSRGEALAGSEVSGAPSTGRPGAAPPLAPPPLAARCTALPVRGVGASVGRTGAGSEVSDGRAVAPGSTTGGATAAECSTVVALAGRSTGAAPSDRSTGFTPSGRSTGATAAARSTVVALAARCTGRGGITATARAGSDRGRGAVVSGFPTRRDGTGLAVLACPADGTSDP